MMELKNKVGCILCLLACALALSAAQGCRREGAGVEPPRAAGVRDGMVLIEGGTFRMGADDEMPDESPAHEVRVESFWMDAREVTVGEFAKFVEATGYKTDAERFGWSGVFDKETATG